jgi:pSer/pThr/pTyr-binding forkhead associated (FHA) protein
MRDSNVGARKRRLAVLRHLKSTITPSDHAFSGIELVNQANDIEAFALACGARLPLRLRVTDERSGHNEEILIELPFAVIGSSELADVRLVHPDVSRNHAYVQILEGRALCCDLGSRTGTHWGTVIRSRSWLTVDEPIYIGPFSIRLAGNDLVDPPSDEMPVALAEDPRPRVPQPNMLLTFLNARSRSGRTRISRVRNPITLIGWSHLCNLRMQHHSVGRVHCSMVWTSRGLWVVDLMCHHATYVNGERVSLARLDDHDVLTLGRFQLKIAYGSSGEMPIFLPSDAPEETPIADLPSRSDEERAQKDSDDAFLPTGELRSDVTSEPALPRISPGADFTEMQKATPVLPSLPPLPPLGDLAGMPLNEAMAVSLMQQFATMQQQLFDHTHQLMAVMAETFQSAHSRQLQLIRDELMRVHELNRELQDLNRNRVDPEVAGPTMATPPMGAKRLSHTEGKAGRAARPQPAAPTSREPHESNSADSASPPPDDASTPAAAPRPAADRRPAAPAAKTRNAQREEERPAARTSENAAGGQEVHAWLSSRITELERERTSRWQRILQLLTQTGGG